MFNSIHKTPISIIYIYITKSHMNIKAQNLEKVLGYTPTELNKKSIQLNDS